MQETKESVGAILAEHYQRTSDLTYNFRQERDRIFLFLVLALGVVTLFNIDANSSASLLIASLAKFLEIKDPGIVTSLQASPLLKIVQTLLLGAVFYLMSNLYHRTASVLRNFQYLEAMEREIREHLKIKKGEVSFSREGGYYWQARQEEGNSHVGFFSRWTKRLRALDLTKIFYTIFLALLLFFSFVLRIKSDAESSNWIFATVDSLIGIPTLIYWWSYARVSKNLDKSLTHGH